MSRPLKEGLDYFPMDCVMDDKIEMLESEKGIEGFGIYVRLLQSIYRTGTGELNINPDGFSIWKMIGKRIGKDEEYTKTIIEYMVGIGLFDKDCFKLGLLTSNGIRKRCNKINKLRENDRYRKSDRVFHTEKDKESKVKESKENNTIYMDFEKSILIAWNSFCGKHPVLSKIQEVSEKRRLKIKKRFEVKSFHAFDAILIAVEKQPFLLGENDRNWKVSFDWLIENDTNYLKVIEMKYFNGAINSNKDLLE